ncbi:MAG: C10 family peptidase [Kiritimatiellae bacterium]|nr:C10 family peptidase [Kiritimatiellia bacterium]
MRMKWMVVLTAGLFTVGTGMATPVGADTARRAAQNWVRFSPKPLGENIGQVAQSVATGSSTNGESLFHVIRMQDGGFVVTSADDDVDPIIAFSESGDGSSATNPASPLYAWLQYDMGTRAKLSRKIAYSVKGTPTTSSQIPKQRWAELLSEENVGFATITSDGKKFATRITSPATSEIRVDKLLSASWGQGNVDGLWTTKCFNWYTPNNYPCGCGATAIAQIMKYWKYPSSSPGYTRTCKVNGTSKSLSMMGGTYSYSDMDDSPDIWTTQAKRKEIGKLTYDCAVACKTDFRSDGSSTTFSDIESALNTFSYSVRSKSYSTSTADNLYATLDAKCPALLLLDSSVSHAVVADGYAVKSGLTYTHINMGWDGTDNCWYNLPMVDASSSGKYYSAYKMMYNIFTANASEVVISGRVTDLSGNPVSGVTVTGISTSGYPSYTATSDAKGIYALFVTQTGKYNITAENSTHKSTFMLSVQIKNMTDNKWGNNLYLQAKPSAPTGVTAQNGTPTTGIRISWTDNANASSYTILRGTGSSVTYATVLASNIFSAYYTDTSAALGVTYYYWVKSVNNIGESVLSSCVTAYRTIGYPTSLNVGNNSTSYVRISWGAVSGATSYEVYRGSSSASFSSASKLSTTTNLYYYDSTASAGVKYRYWVKAVASATSSVNSDDFVIGYLKLTSPSGVTASQGAVQNDNPTPITVSWNAAIGASYYRVYRAESATGTKTALSSWQTARSYSDSTVYTPDKHYYYFVVAAMDVNGTGQSGYSTYAIGWRGKTKAERQQEAARLFGLSATTFSGKTDAIMVVTNTVVFNGTVIGNSNKAELSFSSSGNVQVSFRWKVSSEAKKDYLRLYRDDVKITEVSGTDADWQWVTNGVTDSGTHIWKIAYEKNASSSAGEDKAWIADLSVKSAKIVTFLPGLHGFLVGDNIRFSVDGTVIPPSAVADGGYRFTGWDKNLSRITQDMTVTAQYIKTWNVRFDPGTHGKIASGSANQTIDIGKNANAPTIQAYTNWRFIGWDRSFQNVTADIVVTALYRQTVTVRFDCGEKATYIPIPGLEANAYIYDVGYTYGKLPTAKKRRFDFGGWRTAAGVSVNEKTIAASGVTKLYAVWKEKAVPAPDEYLETDGSEDASAFTGNAVTTYNGWLWGERTVYTQSVSTVLGTVQLKTGKMNKKGDVKLTAKVVAQGVKASLRGTARPSDGTCTATLSGRGFSLRVNLRGNRMWGTSGNGLSLDGARNVFASGASLGNYRGTWTAATGNGTASGSGISLTRGFSAFSLTVGAKGKVTTRGVLADGTKVSATSQLVAIEGSNGYRACVPFFAQLYTGKKGCLGTLLWLGEDRTMIMDGDFGWGVYWDGRKARKPFEAMPDFTGSKLATPSGRHTIHLNPTDFSGGSINGYLPDGLAVSCGKTWKVLSEYHPSGMKLTYKPSTGFFKGTFRAIYEVGPRVSVPVNGVMVGNIGYATALFKKTSSIPLTLE